MAKLWTWILLSLLLVTTLSHCSPIFNSRRGGGGREGSRLVFQKKQSDSYDAPLRQEAISLVENYLQHHPTPTSKASSSSSSSSSSSLSGFTCDTCKAFFVVVRYLFDLGLVWDDIAAISVDVCTKLGIEDHPVCSGVIHLFKDEVLTVVDDVGLSPDEACNVVVGDSCGKGYDPWHQYWNISIPGDKPPVTHQPPVPGSPVTNILHLTDIHYDPLYTPGLTNECGEPVCCRIPNSPGNGSDAAGYWGDYKCDVPYHTLVNLMEHLQSKSSEYEWIYWTGDMPAHTVWTTTREGQLKMTTNITDLMVNYFGNKTVFPSFGNHEGAPVNSFPPPFISGNQSNEWLYNDAAERWGVWLDKFPEWPTINATIRKGGYYVVKVREHLKIISLQTNYCNTGNYWLLINSTDPGDHLKWLIDELLQAERDGDKVHIIGHIAPGVSSCLPVWGFNYHKIVNRFESTIVGQFFGHTHRDIIQIHYDSQNVSRATNVVYIAQSVTTYQYLNLGYKILVIDGDYKDSTSCVVDHMNYYMDLSKTSKTTPPVWEFEYSALEDYSLPDLQPQSWADLVYRFEKNYTLLMKYFHHESKQYSETFNQPCTTVCVCSLLCDMTTATPKGYGISDHCTFLTPMVGNKTETCSWYLEDNEFHRARQHC